MKLIDYRRKKIIQLKDGRFALAAGKRKYITASAKPTAKEVEDLALVWTAQNAHEVAGECAEKLTELRGVEVRLGDLLC